MIAATSCVGCRWVEAPYEAATAQAERCRPEAGGDKTSIFYRALRSGLEHLADRWTIGAKALERSARNVRRDPARSQSPYPANIFH
jgi:hypothetical protein